MEDSGEFIPPEVKIQPNKQESLTHQLEKLDQSRPDHQVFASVLDIVYKNSESIDNDFKNQTNIHYLPRCANKDITTSTITGDYTGSYEYRDILEAVNDIPDPYDIFPLIEDFLNFSKGLSSAEIVKSMAKIISENTNIPVIIEPFRKIEEHKPQKLYEKLENGNLYFHCGFEGNFGIHEHQIKPSSRLMADIEKNNYMYHELGNEYNENRVYDGHFILINEKLLDNPAIIRTCVHELGHVVEEEYFLGKDSEPTEVISSLYGLKIGMMMAKINPEIARGIIFDQMTLYNWVLTGTVAP
ncbi:MAG: hypothetical protein PHX34_00605 [Candidatus Shapirobacteria bacterium]|nr:hypothetical protein [Candidatus Shapirobacteria bacterium]